MTKKDFLKLLIKSDEELYSRLTKAQKDKVAKLSDKLFEALNPLIGHTKVDTICNILDVYTKSGTLISVGLQGKRMDGDHARFTAWSGEANRQLTIDVCITDGGRVRTYAWDPISLVLEAAYDS